MIFSGGLGIGLSVVFGCLLLAFVAELYYLLWWKKRITSIETDNEHCNRPACLKNDPNDSMKEATDSVLHEQDLELGASKDLQLTSFGEEGVDLELMRLHNLAGPPRFLFTINEETREDLDLESDDGKSRGDRSRKGSRTRSLSDLLVAMDTPFLSPLASAPLKSQTLDLLDSYKHQGFNPLFESSPPPKFKFLRDAEEKLHRRLVEDAIRKSQNNLQSVQQSRVKNSPNSTDDRDGSFLKLITKREREIQRNLPQYPSPSSKILPLESSPT